MIFKLSHRPLVELEAERSLYSETDAISKIFLTFGFIIEFFFFLIFTFPLQERPRNINLSRSARF